MPRSTRPPPSPSPTPEPAERASHTGPHRTTTGAPYPPVRVCAECGVGVAAQSSFRRTFHMQTARGKHYAIVGHLCHKCRGLFKNEQAAARFLENELPETVRG